WYNPLKENKREDRIRNQVPQQQPSVLLKRPPSPRNPKPHVVFLTSQMVAHSLGSALTNRLRTEAVRIQIPQSSVRNSTTEPSRLRYQPPYGVGVLTATRR